MGSLSPWHWAILIVVLVLLFGAKKLPDAARSLGKSLRIFKSEVRELQNEGKTDANPTQPAPPTAVQSERVDPPAASPGSTDARSA
ncbi:MAG: Sec-independent protein translocase subunit TatA [Candidatus Sericytochromatia bacterium]